MQLAQSPNFCLRCEHTHSPIGGKCFVNLKSDGRDCQCDQESFVPQKPDQAYKSEQYHFQVLNQMQDMTKRVTYTILSIEGARDLPDWKFENLCWRYWLGFKTGMIYTDEISEKIWYEAQPDTISRCRRKVCEGELNVLREFQERLQNTKEFSPEYWQITEELKVFWKNSKFVPRDKEYLKAKGIKESTIFEWSIMELNDIGL